MLRFAFATTVACALVLFSGSQSSFADDDHAHEKGPHGGSLVELGDEEYHAEIVHDDKEETVTIYLLGKDAKTAVGTDAKDVAINAKVKGKAVQMKVKASAQKGDKAGLSSRFMMKSKELMELLDDPNASPSLRVAINGKTFVGKIEHDHDEEDKKPAPKK